MYSRHVLLLAMMAAPTWAQPTTDQILDKYTQALGGKAAYEKVTSRLMKGEVSIPDDNTTGTAVVYAKAPDRYRATYDFPGYGIVDLVIDGDHGWQKNPDSGLNGMSRQDLEAERRAHAFHRETRLKELYPKMGPPARVDVEGHSAYRIEATPE